MRAARIDSYGGSEVLNLVELDPPTPGPGQVLIEVHGSSINPADIAVRSGWMAEFFPMALPSTLGIDVAGTVVELGDGVVDLVVGDAVYGAAGVMMGGSGGFAEMAVTSSSSLATSPAGLDLLTAATLPLAGISALESIAERLDVQPGNRVLVHGASGGVGLFAVALAKHLGGHVVGTAHTAGVAAVSEVGADEVIDTDQTDLASVDPVDLTLDLVGEDPVLPITVTKPGGRVVGLRMPPDQEAAAAKGVSAVLQGTEITVERLERFRDLVEQGVLSPHVVQVFAIEDIARAFGAKEAGGVHGKIAVRVR